MNRGAAIDSRWVVLTFDDALRNQVTIATDLLDGYGWPWALSVPTGLIDTGRSIWTYELGFLLTTWTAPKLRLPNGEVVAWRSLGMSAKQRVTTAIRDQLFSQVSSEDRAEYMDSLIAAYGVDGFHAAFEGYGAFTLGTWDQLRHLAASGVTILAHGSSHEPLHSTCPEHYLREQIKGPRLDLQIALGLELEGFALPYGVGDSGILKRVRDSGYRFCLTSTPGRVVPGADAFALPRIDADYSGLILRQHMARAG